MQRTLIKAADTLYMGANIFIILGAATGSKPLSLLAFLMYPTICLLYCFGVEGLDDENQQG